MSLRPPPSGLLTALSTCLLFACGPDAAPTGGGPSPRGATDEPVHPMRFSDVTAASGLDLCNVSGDRTQKLAIPENIGQGAAAIDFDGDGRMDLFVANGDVFSGDPGVPRRCALYRNEGQLRFTDVTEQAGLVFSAWCHGAHAVDFDGDGHVDLYVTVYRGPNRFFRNRGDGTFEDATARWGGADGGPSTCAAFFDADSDGDLDLYVGNYVDYDPADPPNGGNPCEWKGLSVSCGPRGTRAAKDTFYENRDGTLVPAADSFGFTAPASYALGAVTGDFDGDGDVDLYVANDSLANYLYVNLGGGRFSERAIEAGVAMSDSGTPQAGMGVEAGDVDRDGRVDLFVTNFSHDTNTLYQNITRTPDEPLFRDGTADMGLGASSFSFLSWGAALVDLDCDGWSDLVVASGHVYPQVDTKPTLDTTYAQSNQIYWNRGTTAGRLSFSEVGRQTPGFEKRAVSRGLVSADFDDDGDIDIFIVELDAPPTLLRNDSRRGHWLGLRLLGAGRNRDAIGARVEITDSSGKTQLVERFSGGSYLSTRDPRLHVGLGSDPGPVTVTVRWPDGARTDPLQLAVDRSHELAHPSRAR